MSNCILCGQRKARRHCLAAHGDICPQCCAQEREARFLCPFECPYLRDSRIHMRPPANAAAFAFPDVNVSLEFVKEYQPLYVFTAATLLTTAGDIPEVIDADVRERSNRW